MVRINFVIKTYSMCECNFRTGLEKATTVILYFFPIEKFHALGFQSRKITVIIVKAIWFQYCT